MIKQKSQDDSSEFYNNKSMYCSLDYGRVIGPFILFMLQRSYRKI